MWSNEDTKKYRVEVERRFRARTPAVSVLDVPVESRVVHSEMRNWSMEILGKVPPEVELKWAMANSNWYRRMSRRVVREAEKLAKG